MIDREPRPNDASCKTRRPSPRRILSSLAAAGPKPSAANEGTIPAHAGEPTGRPPTSLDPRKSVDAADAVNSATSWPRQLHALGRCELGMETTSGFDNENAARPMLFV
jgi:hypothetical protein